MIQFFRFPSITLALLLMARAITALADQVTLTNGDRITGKVVKKDGDSLVVKTDRLGEGTIKWGNVSAGPTDAPLTVVLPQDVTVKGTLQTQGDRLESATAAGKHEGPL